MLRHPYTQQHISYVWAKTLVSESKGDGWVGYGTVLLCVCIGMGGGITTTTIM